jgi:hypothetical protein
MPYFYLTAPNFHPLGSSLLEVKVKGDEKMEIEKHEIMPKLHSSVK